MAPPSGPRRASAPQKTNRELLNDLNEANGITSSYRDRVLELLEHHAPSSVNKLIAQYLASMSQDRDRDWLAQKPSLPEIISGEAPHSADHVVDIMGIGGMFAYLNVLYQAHKNGGRHCVVSHPHDIFTFSGWTLHPEEDMDQRLIQMFQTRHLLLNEMKRLAGLSETPQSLRYKSFRIDYTHILALAKENPGELLRILKVALHYAALELTDRNKRFARMNLERNAVTVRALEEMGRIGNDLDRDIVNMCGRVVFEVAGEARSAWKGRLKEQYGLVGESLAPSDVKDVYGADIGILDDMADGRIHAVRYPGGHFLAGYREKALEAAAQNDVLVYDNAVVKKIIVDARKEKHAVLITQADGEDRTVIADVLLLALGDYGKDVISVDGVSTLFMVVTDNERYRMHPTGMGEGGTIHVVPVWSGQWVEQGQRLFYHLGKATNGAVMGRDPARHKPLFPKRSFLAHLEAHLRKIIPAEATFLWLAATECGRPVSAEQGYSLNPLPGARKSGNGSGMPIPLSFKATGGCGLGGNTAIIPEVQAILDRRGIQGQR